MLELKDYFTTEIKNLKDFITTVFVIVDDIYNKHTPLEVKNRKNISMAKLSDSEIITISLIGELLGHDSENSWISYVSKNMRDLFPNICERSRFNRTRRNLMSIIEFIRKKLSSIMNSCSDDILIVDSFPLPICRTHTEQQSVLCFATR